MAERRLCATGYDQDICVGLHVVQLVKLDHPLRIIAAMQGVARTLLLAVSLL